jgi:hypothetical protein
MASLVILLRDRQPPLDQIDIDLCNPDPLGDFFWKARST